MAWPAAGPSTTITSHSPLRSSCLILPSTTMSSMPGAAVATTSMTPGRRQPLGDASEAVLAEVLLQRRRGRDRPRSGRSPTRSASTGLPSSSTTRTRWPASAAARARTAVTVVLPTPPLPATIVTREADSSGTGSTDSGGTFAQTSDRPAGRRGRASACSPPASPARAAGRRRPGTVDVLQVSGLFDPIVDRCHRRRHRPGGRRRRAGPGPPGEHPRRGGRPRRDRGPARARRRGAGARSPSGSARPAPACTARPASCSPWPTSPAWRRARGSATSACRCGPTASTVDFGAAESALRNGSLGLSEARRLGVFDQRVSDEGIPTIANMVDALDGYEEGGVVARDDRGAGARRRQRPAGHHGDRPLRQARPGRPAVPHRRQPGGHVPAAAHRPGPARLRVLHRRRRHRRRRRRHLRRARLHRPGHAAGPGLGGRSAPGRDAGLRRRRAGRRPALLDRGRHRAHGDRQPVAVRAAAGCHAAAVVDHAASPASAASRWRSWSACRRWSARGSPRRRSAGSG